MEALKKKIKDYCTTDDEITAAVMKIKELKQSHAEMSQSIIKTMVSLGIENMTGIDCMKKVQKSGLNKDSLQNGLASFLDKNNTIKKDSVENAVDHILENRDEKEVYKLKRKNNRNNNNKGNNNKGNNNNGNNNKENGA